MKTAKEYLASGEPLPEGISPEDLPAAMDQDPDDDRGHGDCLPKSFLRITPLDKAGRRALWIRFDEVGPRDDGELGPWHDGEPAGGFVELRAGREGDDAQLTLTAGETLTKEQIARLVDVLLTAKFGLEQ